MKRFFAILLTFALLLSLSSGIGAAVPQTAPSAASTQSLSTQSGSTGTHAIASPLTELGESLRDSATGQKTSLSVQKVENTDTDLKQAVTNQVSQTIPEETISPDTMVKVIVVLEEESLLQRGYSTSELADSSLTRRAVSSIERAQNSVLAQIHRIAGENVEEKYRYDVVISGLSLTVPYGTLDEIRAISGVRSAFPAPSYAVPEDMSDADAQPNTSSATGLSGATRTWDSLGYRGEGMRIAIIDTGLDADHPSFADAPTLTDSSLEKNELSGILSTLNAAAVYNGTLTADDVYHSEKVPYGFNYVDENLNIGHDLDYQGDHGSHVAGIAAANDIDSTDVVGVAPEAQLIVMKVFGENGGAYFDDILAALEDCFRLNVDAVNLSLGGPAGFTSEGDEIDAIFAQVLETDMILSVSSGNEASFSYGNAYGTDMNFASDPDVGLMGSPGTYIGTTTVASLENEQVHKNYLLVGEEKVGYNDVCVNPIVDRYSGQVLEYVMIPGYGDVSDYEGLDVYGRIAVVARGGLDFTAKQRNAYDAGAAVCLVYDNIEGGELINMMDAELLPNAFLTQAGGRVLAEAADADGIGTLTVGIAADMIPVDSGLTGKMSSFSSVGVSPDLTLKPDITSYGGNIYSCRNDGTYGVMSGTSMSAPAVAGMSALVLQYLHAEHPTLSEAQMHTVAEALLMSTATAVIDPDNATVHYSPRMQGAGNANIYNAIISPAYLTVNGSTPKVSLGDDDTRSGSYTFQFEVTNFSDADLAYRLDGYAMTDQVVEIDGQLYMSETGRKLEASLQFSAAENTLSLDYDLNGDLVVSMSDVALLLDMVNGVAALSDRAASFDLNEDGVLNTADVQLLYELLATQEAQIGTLTVPANETVCVTAVITLTDADKAYMDTCYENGVYVEGFVTLTPVSEDAVELSLPYLGFYGDWSDARIFDSGFWFQSEDEMDYMRYPHVIFTQFADDDYGFNLGLNPYLTEEYDPWHNVLSPNGDGYQDYIGEIYLGLMRNAKQLDFVWEIYDEAGAPVQTIVQTAEYARKSYYYSYYGMCVPFIYTDYNFDSTELQALLKEGYSVRLSVEAYLDDGDDELDERLCFPVGDGLDALPIYIDNTAPVIVDERIDCWYNEANDARRLEFTVQDNHAIAAVVTLTEAGDIIDVLPVEDTDQPVTLTLDVTDYDATFYVAVCDYGANETTYAVSFYGKNSIDLNSFYGYRYSTRVTSGDFSYSTDAQNGWYSFRSADNMLRHSSQYEAGETAIAAADYVDGYILGIDTEGGIFAIRSGQWSRTRIGTLEIDGTVHTAVDMAFDVKHNVLYILSTDGDYTYNLVRMDYLTAEYEVLGSVYDSDMYDDYDFNHGITLACDNDGVLYSVDAYSGDLFRIDPETCSAVYVGSTGFYPQNSRQSMTVDHETNELYWAANEGDYGDLGVNPFYRVDKETGELTYLADLESNCALTGLFKPYSRETSLYPDDAVVTALQLSETELLLAEGLSADLICKQLPYYADALEVTWSSSDPETVHVEDGHLEALRAGKAVITARAGALYASCEVEVFVFTDHLYAFDMGTSGMWVEFPAADPSSMLTRSDTVLSNSGFSAAAYHDGWVYACEYDGSFYRLDPDTLQGTKLSNLGAPLMGMAFNYTDGFMYGIQMQVDSYGYQSYQLIRVNLTNGDLRIIQELDEYTFGTVLCSLAIDAEGYFYLLGTDNYSLHNQLLQCSLSSAYGMEMLEIEQIADLSRYPTYGYGALHYSFSNNGLYWTNDDGHLLWVNLSDMSQLRAVDLGLIGYDSVWPQFLAMYTIPEPEPTAPVAEPESVTLREQYLLLVGGSAQVGLSVEPWNAVVEADYSIRDTEIATVDTNGEIRGKQAGETELTVTIPAMEFSKTVPVSVVQATGNVYGYQISDFVSDQDAWIHVADTQPSEILVDSYSSGSFTVSAGTYYDGSIYAIIKEKSSSAPRMFARFDTGDYAPVRLAEVSHTIRDMAFDYTTGTLYGIAEGGLLTGAIVQFNTKTGEMTQIADTGLTLAAMTIDAKGQMLAICQTDDCLYAIDKQTGAASCIGSTGVDAGAWQQSMAYDPETGNLYWAQAADNKTSALRLVSAETGASTGLGTLGSYGALLSCLHTERENEPDVPAQVAPNGLRLPERAFVLTGTSSTLQATVLPVSVANVDQQLVWQSADESIATVKDGVVTAIAAGQTTITATNANGDCAVCQITVSDTERAFYAYDRTNRQWIRFEGDDTANITVMRADAADELPLSASTCNCSTLYAYDTAGCFYRIDPDTFARTLLGSGVSEQTVTVESYDWWSDSYLPMECGLTPIDLSWDAQSGKLYAVLQTTDEYGYSLGSLFAEVRLDSGEIVPLFHSSDIQPGNLMVLSGKALFVDTYNSGMLMMLDLNADAASIVSLVQLGDYWGEITTSRSLILDEYTDTVYVVRDLTDTWSVEWEETQYGQATLYTVDLTTGSLTPTTPSEAYIGSGVMVCGLFMR